MLDSNQRRHKPADLQSAPVGHLGNLPNHFKAPFFRGQTLIFGLCCSLCPGFVSRTVRIDEQRTPTNFRATAPEKLGSALSRRQGRSLPKFPICCNMSAAKPIMGGSKSRARSFARAWKPRLGPPPNSGWWISSKCGYLCSHRLGFAEKSLAGNSVGDAIARKRNSAR